MNQPYFEDVEPGDEIGPLVKQPSREEVRTARARLTNVEDRIAASGGVVEV